jgi:hypothetical protein
MRVQNHVSPPRVQRERAAPCGARLCPGDPCQPPAEPLHSGKLLARPSTNPPGGVKKPTKNKFKPAGIFILGLPKGVFGQCPKTFLGRL